MRFRQLSLRCECGRVPARIGQVGLTPQHQLVIHWKCTGCKRFIYIVKDLADCWRDCPKPEGQLDVFEVSAAPMSGPDAEFLHSVGVRLPDEEQS
jgi:hypothetical protein